MAKINQDNITQMVVDHGDGGKKSPRLHEIYESFIRHMHAFVKEVDLNDQELEAGRQWFSNMAKPNNDFPAGEVHLFSDLCGISELVRLMHDDRKDRGNATETNLEGPLYVPNPPERQNGDVLGVDLKGETLFMRHRVLAPDGSPVEGATVDIWQPDSQGYYDIQDEKQEDGNFRGLFRTDAAGEVYYKTVVPLGYNVPLGGPCGAVLHALGRHGWRPAHIHYIIKAEGCDELTTMTYIAGAKFVDSDTVFSVKDALITLEKHDSPEAMQERGVDKPFWTSSFDFTLDAAGEQAVAA